MTTIKLDPSMIQASGTPNGLNFLRGDGSWEALIMPPVWSTVAGSIAIANEQDVFTTTVMAVDVNNLTLSYTVTSGALPTGLVLNSSTGVITGTTPMVAANTTSTFTISASNGTNSTQRMFSITVNNSTNEPPTWSTAAGSLGTVNTNSSFSYSLSATDPNLDVLSYSITSGGLPAGLSMSSLGVITGTTSTIGSTTTSSFTVSVNDGLGGIVTRNFSITVVVPNIIPNWNTNSGSLGNFYVGTNLNISLSATDPDSGPSPLSYSIISGSIPAGSNLNSSGVISGTVTTAGTSNFTVRVTDGLDYVDRNFSIVVLQASGLYVGTYGSNSFAYSLTNGSSWQQVTMPVYSGDPNAWVYSIAAMNGIFVAIVQGSTPNGKILKSADLNNWVDVTPIAWDWNDIIVGNGYFVAVASNGIGYSTDGQNWTTNTQASGYWVTYSSYFNKFLVNNNGGLWSATNPSSWTLDFNAGYPYLNSVMAYGRSIFFGRNGDSRDGDYQTHLYATSDGTTYADSPGLVTGWVMLGAGAYLPINGGTYLIGTGRGYSRVPKRVVNGDSVNWGAGGVTGTSIAIPGSSTSFSGLAASQGKFIAIGNNAICYESATGVDGSWTNIGTVPFSVGSATFGAF